MKSEWLIKGRDILSARPGLKSAGRLAVKKTPAEGAKPVPMHGKATCGARRRVSTGPMKCRWLRESSLGQGNKSVTNLLNARNQNGQIYLSP